MQQLVSCPPLGHRALQHSLKNITIGDVQSPEQITKFIRPASCIRDEFGLTFRPGELQKKDVSTALTLFAYPNFVANTFLRHRETFKDSECRIYQFQSVPRSGPAFVFGLFITDGFHNLVDFCLEQPSHKRKPVLERIMRALCTPVSVTKRLTQPGVH